MVEGWILSFYCAFAGWTSCYYWCIAVYFSFVASKALHRTLYHAEHFRFPQFQPWMLITLTHTQLVLVSISILLGAVLCLPRLCLPQGLEPTAKPPAGQHAAPTTQTCHHIVSGQPWVQGVEHS